MEGGVSEQEMTVQMVAQKCGVSRMTVYNWINAGKVKTYGVRGATRVDMDSLEQHLANKPVTNADGGGTSDTSSDTEVVTGL